MKKHIALIAHDQKKDELVDLASEFSDFLRQCVLLATAGTGKRIAEEVGLHVERKLSGAFGGDLQIAAEVVEGKIDCLIFLRDPGTAHAHEPDVNALVRACDLHNVVCATNLATARLLLLHLQSPRHNHN
ncbi:methylglyoxal synthase [soil metagenome]